MIEIFKNDKLWVTLAVTVITILCILYIPEKADTIVLAALSGMFGYAVGGMRGGKRATDVQNGQSPNQNIET